MNQRLTARRALALTVLSAALLASPVSPSSAGPLHANTIAAGDAACDTGSSAARVIRGKDGLDPNSVTAAEAQRADTRLQARINVLKKAGALRPDGSLASSRAFRIRTHVHVITRSDGTGGVTATQIRDQIAVMNEAFAGKTARPSVRTPFSFLLVSTDVTRNDTWYDWQLNDDGTETQDAIDAKTALHRGGWGDLNIYIAGLGSGLLGYATFPQDGVLPLDGLVLLNDSLPGGAAAPYNEGDTATHEIGHWLGLFHTFENGCTAPGDYVLDTPYQFDGDNIFFCDEADDTCRQPGRDPVHNFMSYGDDPCLDRFTLGQDLRMIGTWLAYRT